MNCLSISHLPLHVCIYVQIDLYTYGHICILIHSMSPNLQEYVFSLDKRNTCQLLQKIPIRSGKYTAACNLSRKKPECFDQLLHQAIYKTAPRQSQPPRPPSWTVQQEYERKMVQRNNLSLCSEVQQKASQGEYSSWSSPDTVPGSQLWLVGTRVRQDIKEDVVLWNGF